MPFFPRQVWVPWIGTCLLTLFLPLSLVAQCEETACKGPNLVFDGNFEEGVVDPANPALSFGTDFGYIACPVNQYNQLWGKISILRNPTQCYPNWNGYDHTFGDSSGRMLMVDFPSSNPAGTGFLNIWSQTVQVEAGATYCFGAWYRNLNVGLTAPEPTFRYVVDGGLIGISPNLPANGNWERYAFTYTVPAGVSQITISIENGVFGGSGNDLAIDDIEFRKLPGAGISPTAVDDESFQPSGINNFIIPIINNDLSNDPAITLDPSQLSLLSHPAASEGNITLYPNGLVNFTPAQGFSGLSTFSYEICHSDGCCSQARVLVVLNPVLSTRVEDFRAKLVRQVSELSWFTQDGESLSYFEVERSDDQQTFLPIGTVANDQPNHLPGYYEFQDEEVPQLEAEVLYYRIKEVKTDGSTAYSEVEEVRVDTNPSLVQAIYPNPVMDQVLNVEYLSPKGESLSLELYSIDGRLRFSQRLHPNTYFNQEKIDLADFPSGIYLLKLSNSQISRQERIIVLN